MRISDWSSDVCSSDLFCLDKETPSFDSLCAVERFAVNVLRAEQHALSVRFSTAGADKWDTVDHDLWAGGLPVLRGCLASFACRREALYEGGDHVIIVGRVDRKSTRLNSSH